MSEPQKTPVTLETLMRLKRAERPAGEFWTQFDKELRAKQLAAIVEKRPWWASQPRIYSLFARHRIALGGAAAMAITLLTVNEFRTSAPAPWVAHAGPETAYAATAPAAIPVMDAPASPSAPTQVAMAPAAARNLTAPAASANAFEPELASMISLPSDRSSPVERSDRGMTFSSRPIEASFATLAPAQPGIMRSMLNLAQGFQTPLVANRAKMVEPLARMTPPSEESRSRLIAETMPIAAGFETSAASMSDHNDSRADDRLYDSINRYSSGSSDRLSIRF